MDLERLRRELDAELCSGSELVVGGDERLWSVYNSNSSELERSGVDLSGLRCDVDAGCGEWFVFGSSDVGVGPSADGGVYERCDLEVGGFRCDLGAGFGAKWELVRSCDVEQRSVPGVSGDRRNDSDLGGGTFSDVCADAFPDVHGR